MELGVRSSGVLLHPSSLPGPYGIGDVGPSAHRFAEALAGCGQSWWQMLPISPPGAGWSPYSAVSSFACDPLLLSLDLLAGAGYLSKEELAPPAFPEERADFAAAERFKRPLFSRAFDAFEAGAGPAPRGEFEAFCASNAGWIEDYALFAALRRERGGAPWFEWAPGLRSRESGELERSRARAARAVRLEKFLQWQFARQWGALRGRCAELGLGLIGDVPIFVAHDSADAWAHRELFWLDPDGRPLKVAGVPPDYFSKTGQLWGNPLYRWDVLRGRGFDWWIERFRLAFERFDAVRLDHFIGFHNCWEIPAGARTAEHGRWAPGPGAELFERARKALGPLQFIAEDLGAMTREVEELRERLGLPGLRVLEFSFGPDPKAEGYHPRNFPRRCVVYTGTHDNDTVRGWFKSLEEKERSMLLRFLGTDGSEIHWDLIGVALRSSAATAVIPMQDLLGLGPEARMNRPGSADGNWSWRMKKGAFNRGIAGRLARLTEDSGRRPEAA